MSPVEGNKNIGAIRSHLYNYCFAKGAAIRGVDATVIFRVDDTNKDKHRNDKTRELFQFFNEELGFRFDVTPDNSMEKIGQSVFQSERQTVYAKYVEELCEKQIACLDATSGLVLFDIQKFIEQYSDTLEVDEVLRGKLVFRLLQGLRGGQLFFPLQRSDKSALYHLATVVDDAMYGVTHVIRGQDKLSVIECQEMVRIALGFEQKKYLHTPLLLDQNGALLGGATTFDDFVKKGIAPQALISYLISSGYGNPELVYSSIQEFITHFDANKIHTTNGKFDFQQLHHLNKKIVKHFSPETYIYSLVTYLKRNEQDSLAEQLKTDSLLRELMISLHRESKESLGILQSILTPTYEEIGDEVRAVLPEVLSQIEKNPQVFPLVKTLGRDKKIFYQAASWILVGKIIFPNIEGIFHYLLSRSLLVNRINSAKKHLLHAASL